MTIWMSTARVVGAAAVVWSSGASAQPVTAGADSRPPVVTTELRTQLSASYNNPGIQQSLDWSKRRLLRPGGGPWTADAHLAAGVYTTMSPSFARVGAWAQYAPLSVFSLRVGVEPAQYFGTFDSLMSFDRQTAAFDNDSRRERGGARTGRVLRLYATPTLRARAGPWVGVVTGDVERWSASADGPWIYEPTRDTLLESHGSMLRSVRSLVMREHVSRAGTRVGLGAVHTLQRVDGKRLNQVQRLGGIVTLQSDGRWRWLRRPALNVAVARYLDDPSKDKGWTGWLTLATTLRVGETPRRRTP